MSDYRHHAERFDVPGGWIYFGGPLPSPVYVADPSQWAHAPATTSPPDPRLDQVLSLLQQLRQDIQTMSGTLPISSTPQRPLSRPTLQLSRPKSANFSRP